MAQTTLLIADPSLSDLRGHHFNLTRLIGRAATTAGLSVRWLVSAQLSPELAATHPEAIPAFGHGMYDPYREQTSGGRLRRFVKRIFGRSAPTGTMDPAGGLVQSMIEGLRSGISDAGAGPQDHLLLHTADGATYRAIAELYTDAAAAQLPTIHVCTPYDPVGVMPNRKDASEVADAISAISSAGLLGTKVHLYAENEGLAEHLSALWGTDVHPLPLPVPATDGTPGTAADTFRQDTLGVDNDCLVIASLGAARLEKGFNLFPDVVRRTFELAGADEFPGTSPEKIRFALHASPQIIGRHPVIATALEKLEAFGTDKVTLLTDPLSDEGYHALLEAADVICLPYNVADYRVRSSGVVTEAVAAGKFLVATEGSYPGRVAAAFEGGTGTTPMEMAKALLTIASERAERTPRLEAAANAFRDEHSPARYLERLRGLQRQA